MSISVNIHSTYPSTSLYDDFRIRWSSLNYNTNLQSSQVRITRDACSDSTLLNVRSSSKFECYQSAASLGLRLEHCA
jgi:hypothetical protein